MMATLCYAVLKCLFEQFKQMKQMFTGGWVVARILADFHFLLTHSAHNKRRDEHDASRGNDFKLRNINAEFLVVEIRQAQAESAVQVARCRRVP